MTHDAINKGSRREAKAIGEVLNREKTILVGRVYLWESGAKGVMWLNEPELAETVVVTFAWKDWQRVMGSPQAR